MDRIRVIPLLLLLGGGGSVWASEFESQEQQFLQQLVRRNLTVQATQLEAQSARETSSGAQTLLWPQLSLAGNAEAWVDPAERSAQGAATLSQWAPGGGTAKGVWSAGTTQIPDALPNGGDWTRDTMSLELSFRQPLLRGFGERDTRQYALQSARAQEKVQLATSRAEVLALLQRGRTAWWNYRTVRSLESVNALDTVRTQRWLERTRVRLQTGAGSVLDTLSARSQHLGAVLAYQQARVQRGSLEREMLTLLDTTDLPVFANDTLLPDLGADPAFPTSAELLAKSEERAPDLARTAALVAKYQLDAQQRRSQSLPRFDVLALAVTSVPEGNPARGWNVGARAELEWNFGNGVERAAWRSALLQVRSGTLRAQAARQELSWQLERALQDWQAARDKARLTREQAAVDRLRLDAAETQLQTGALSWNDAAVVRKEWLLSNQSAWAAVAECKALEAEIEARTGEGPARLGWSWGNP